MGSVDPFFNWGMLELGADQMKRTKNSRIMHMLFNVQYGTVEVKVHENEFTVHKGGIWQVPRGTLLFFLPPRFLATLHFTLTRTTLSVMPRLFFFSPSLLYFPALFYPCRTAVTLCSRPVGIRPVAPASPLAHVLQRCTCPGPGGASERLFSSPAGLWRQHAWHAYRACSVMIDAKPSPTLRDGSQAVVPFVFVNRCAAAATARHNPPFSTSGLLFSFPFPSTESTNMPCACLAAKSH